jgi:hypothetical protein
MSTAVSASQWIPSTTTPQAPSGKSLFRGQTDSLLPTAAGWRSARYFNARKLWSIQWANETYFLVQTRMVTREIFLSGAGMRALREAPNKRFTTPFFKQFVEESADVVESP